MSTMYRALLRCYPADYRDAHGDELVDTALELHDGRFSWREAASLAGNGLRQRAISTTHASPAATWRYAARLAVWFSLLNWLSFRLLNSWQVARDPGAFAGRDRIRIGDVDVIFPTFHPSIDVLPGNGQVVTALTALFFVATVAALFLRAGPTALALAAGAGLLPSLIIETTIGDVLIMISHFAAAAWFVVQGDRRHVLTAPLSSVFLIATAGFMIYLEPRSPRFEQLWGIADMTALGFGWALFVLGGLLLMAHDPRLLPICASVYAVSLVQIALPAIGDDTVVGRTPWSAALAQGGVVLAAAIAVSFFGNRRLQRI